MFNFSSSDINRGYQEFKDTKNAVLLDVRTREEYDEGHIPLSKNVPLDEIDKVKNMVSDKHTPLYLYCYSGVRSLEATQKLVSLCFEKVNNIGGISSYKGEIEK